MKKAGFLGGLLFFTALAAGAVPASPRILILYKSSEGPREKNAAVEFIEPVLTDLGWKVEESDIDKGLPGSMEGYAAVLSWHRTPLYSDPTGYLNFLRSQLEQGRKVVILGNLGALSRDGKSWLSNEDANRFFLPFGLDYRAAYTGEAGLLSVATRQDSLEKAPSQPYNYYLNFHSVDPANQVFLDLQRSDQKDSHSAMVVKTPFGGMAAEGTLTDPSSKPDEPIWLLNRKAFLQEVLAPATALQPLFKHKLLGLYKGSEGATQTSNELLQFASAPLRELGYLVEMQDVEKGLPDKTRMASFDGVVSWYRGSSMHHVDEYLAWLTEQMLAGRKVIIMGNFGAFQELIDTAKGPVDRWVLSREYNNFFYPFGLEFRGMWTNQASKLEVLQRDPKIMVDLPSDLVNHYYKFRAVSQEDKVYLGLGRKDAADADSAIVVRTPFGGMALEHYIYSQTPGTWQTVYHIDLRQFFADVLHYVPQTPLQPVVPLSQGAGPGGGGEGAAGPLPRRVLAFYLRDQKEDPQSNSVHILAETTLNYLGQMVDYRAAEDALPSDAEMAAYKGIVVWLSSNSLPRAQAFDDWLTAQIKAGRRVVLLGELPSQDSKMGKLTDMSGLFQALGLQLCPLPEPPGVSDRLAFNAQRRAIVASDSSLVGYEEEPDISDLNRYSWPRALARPGACRVALRVRDERGPSDVIVTSDHGGVAFGELAVYQPAAVLRGIDSVKPQASILAPGASDQDQRPAVWTINPFRFFEKALGLEGQPRPDVTTLNGSRIFYIHIDGDAATAISRIDSSSYNGEILYREILSKSPFPHTVSFITRDLEEPSQRYYAGEVNMARRIAALDNIELASHTHTHPFSWKFGDLGLVSQDSLKLRSHPPDLDLEIEHSLDYLNRWVAPPGRKCKLLLWSGNCDPSGEIVARVEANGVDNMNGGDPLYDHEHPWLAGLTSLFADAGGGHLQYHTSASGDYRYTRSWTTNFSGMREVTDHYDWTDKPLRLRPLNLYYHYYIAERQEGLDGLRAVYDYALKHHVAPLFASEYVNILKDMATLQLGRDEGGGYRIDNAGDLRTVRFDHTQDYPDLKRSQGIIGFWRSEESLYVALDENRVHHLFMTGVAPTVPYLSRGSHRLSAWRASPERVEFVSQGSGPAYFEVANLSPSSSYRVSLEGQNPTTARSDKQGTLIFQATLSGYRPTLHWLVERIAL